MASILSVTNTYNNEPKRKNRWNLLFSQVPVFTDSQDSTDLNPATTGQRALRSPTEMADMALSLLTASRPQIDIGETEFHRLNEKSYWPEGKATYEPIEISYYDRLGLNTGSIIYGWFRSVFDFKTGAVGYKRAFVAEGILEMLDPKGTVVERWTLVNCWPKTVNFNDLSYEDTGAAMINVTIRFDRAIPQFIDNSAIVDGANHNNLWAASAYGIPAGTFDQGLQSNGTADIHEFRG